MPDSVLMPAPVKTTARWLLLKVFLNLLIGTLPVSYSVMSRSQVRCGKRAVWSWPGAVDDEAIGSGLRRPYLARPAQDLANVRAAPVARKHLEVFLLGFEQDDGVGA